jgi:dihydropteroate synthase
MHRPLVMGIVNLTPDSFSDGGQFLDAGAALAHAQRLIAEGADILDIGAESTRPGATPVSQQVELERLLPLIEAIRRESPIPISVDTMKPAVARNAIAAGADIWNDVSALDYSPDSAYAAAEMGCGIVLMHMRGEPRTMQDDPQYEDVVDEVEEFLIDRAEMAQVTGVDPDKIWIDPGIGFGKTAAHNYALIAALPRLAAHGYRILVGASRKRFIGPALAPQDRLPGSLAIAIAAANADVTAVRVHDVAATLQALEVDAAIRKAISL